MPKLRENSLVQSFALFSDFLPSIWSAVSEIHKPRWKFPPQKFGRFSPARDFNFVNAVNNPSDNNINNFDNSLDNH